MKKVLCSILAIVFVIGIFFSAPITIEAFAVENEVVEKNTNLILPDKRTGIYRYQLTIDGESYILHGPVINTETGTMHGSVSGDITLPTVHPDDGKPIVELADNAFMYAGGITSVTIPGNYKKIGAYVFCDTPSLTSVTLQDGVEEIGMYAFSDCSNLVNVTFPDSVAKVGEGVLSETAYSNDQNSVDSNWYLNGLYVDDVLLKANSSMYKNFSVKYGTKIVAAKAFYNVDTSEVTIPNTVKVIGEFAFGYKASVNKTPEKIEDFVIYGFKNSVAESYATENGFKFLEIDMEGNFQYRLNDAGSGYIVTYYHDFEGKSELVFPESHNGLPVEGIDSNILSSSSNVVAITLPDTLKTIDDSAFFDAVNLKVINNLHDNIQIGENAFYQTGFYNDKTNWTNDALYIGNHLVNCDINYQGEFTVKPGTVSIATSTFNNRTGITKITLPDSIKYIGDRAFYWCTNLTTVELGSGLKKIGDHAFGNCNSLETILNVSTITEMGLAAFESCASLKSFEFNSELIEIPDFAFNNCGSLTGIVIPDKVTSVGEAAFLNCGNVKNIVLGKSIVTIGENAFNGCLSVNEQNVITFPSEVKEIGENAFYISTLQKIVVSVDNQYYCDENGILYNKGKTEIFFIPLNFSDELKIGPELIKIPSDAFEQRDCITSVSVDPANSNYLAENGVLYSKDKSKLFFCIRSKTEEFTIPDDVEIVGNAAFKHCSGISSLKMSSSLITIEDNAFSGLNIESIVVPNSVKYIGKNAFKECQSLSNVTLSDNLTEINEGLFYGCMALTQINIPSAVTKIDAYAFAGTSLDSIVLPDNLKEIGQRAFGHLSTLETVDVPESVEVLRVEAFYDCNQLKTITLRNGVIEKYAFQQCNELTTVNFVEGLEQIDSYAFEGCSGLKELVIPKGVKVEAYAFNNCTGLETIDISAHTVEMYAFSGCINIDKIKLNAFVEYITEAAFSDTAYYKNAENWNEDGSLIIDDFLLHLENNVDFSKIYEFKNGIKGFAADIFHNSGLKSIRINGSIKSIPANAFEGCWLESLIIEEGVEIIGTSAVGLFSGTLEIPSTVTRIENGAFRSQGINSITVASQNEKYVSVDGVVYTKDMKTLVAYPVGRSDHYEMPDTVEKIQPGALEMFGGQSIRISDLVTELSPYLFSHSSIQSVVIPDKVTKISEFCFRNAYNLQVVVLPSGITSIANDAFNGCSNLKTIILPESVKEIGDNAFYGCSSLTNINLSDINLEKIGKSCFESCSSLISVTMPESLKEISSRCFAACSSLKSVDFSNVSKIAPSAFFGCTSLAEVTVPETINEIGEMALGYANPANLSFSPYSIRVYSPKLYNSPNSKSSFGLMRNMSQQETELSAQVPNFKIFAKTGTEGEKYAKVNDLKFVDITHKCSGGTATCMNKAICSTCSEEYGEFDLNNHASVSTKWFTENGYHYHKCECGAELDKAVCSGGTATCTSKAVCLTCNEEYGELNSNNHANVSKAWTTENGYHWHECECGAELDKATCSGGTATCKKKAVCTTCNNEYGEVNKDNHSDLKTLEAVAPDCTNTGLTEGKKCFDCGETPVPQTVVKATGHKTSTINAKAATCTTDGYTGDTYCSTCKSTTEKGSVIKATGHKTSTINAKAATCTADGYTGDTYCSTCKSTTAKGSVIKATGHKTSTINAKAATCTADGYTGDTYCSTCKSTTAKGSVIKATGHKITIVNKKDATTKEAGYTGDKVCSVCKVVLEKGKEIPKIIVSLTTPAVTVKNSAKGITISWNAIENAESYIVYRRVYNASTKKWSSWSKLKTDYTSTSYVDTTVTLGTQYRYTVRAVNGDVMSKYESTATIKYNVTPTVKVSNTANGVKVTWSTAANATGYRVYRSTLSNGKWSGWKNMGTAKANKTAWTDKNVKTGVTYKYTVRAVYNKVLSSYNKNGVSVLFLTTPTVKIANASNGIKVSWSKVNGATGYVVYSSQYDVATQKWSGWSNRGTVNTNSWVDTAVKSGVQYKYTVRAANGKTLSAYKGTSGLMFLSQPTVKIANVAKGIKVTWSMCDGATGYTVYRSEYDAKTKKWSKWKSRGTAAATKSSWTDKKVTSGKYYKYTVRAVNGNVKSSYVSSGKLYYLLTPTVTATAVQNGIKVSWTQSAGAKGYTVYSSQYDPVTNKWSNWSNRGTAKADQSSWVDKKAQAGVKYRYTVRAVNNKAKSAYTASENVNR